MSQFGKFPIGLRSNQTWFSSAQMRRGYVKQLLSYLCVIDLTDLEVQLRVIDDRQIDRQTYDRQTDRWQVVFDTALDLSFFNASRVPSCCYGCCVQLLFFTARLTVFFILKSLVEFQSPLQTYQAAVLTVPALAWENWQSTDQASQFPTSRSFSPRATLLTFSV